MFHLKYLDLAIPDAGAWQRKVKGDGIQAQAKRMARDPGIPQEITLRFNARLILIEPPNEMDFQKAIERVHGDLSLAKPDGTVLKQLVAQAVQARCGLRWVEQYVSDLLVFHPHLRRALEPHPQTSSGKRVIPAYEMKAEIENLYGLLEAAEPSISHLKAKMGLINRRLKQGSSQAQTLLNLDESIMTPEMGSGLHGLFARTAQPVLPQRFGQGGSARKTAHRRAANLGFVPVAASGAVLRH